MRACSCRPCREICECIPKVNTNQHAHVDMKQCFTETHSGYTGREITLLTRRQVCQCLGGICTVHHCYSSLHDHFHRICMSAEREVPPYCLQIERESPFNYHTSTQSMGGSFVPLINQLAY